MNCKDKLRRLLCLFLTLVLFLPTASAQESVTAEEIADPLVPTLTAEGEKALIYNLEYDRILWSEGEADSIAPASFVKIMTAVLGFEYLAEHGDHSHTVSEYTVKKATGTRINLKEGETLPFSELLYALVVGSANDAALAIAEVVSGSEAEFIARMNQKAKDLGMESTYFANPTGMDQSAMSSTLADLVKLCAYAYRINDYMVMTDVVEHTIPATNLSKARKLRTKNLLVDTNPYTGYHTKEAMGMSAGSTNKAGFCLATATENNGLTFLILIAQGKYQNDIYSSFTDGATLIRHARTRYRLTTIMPKDKAITEMKVELGKETDSVMLVSASELSALLPVDYLPDKLEFRYSYLTEHLTAPVAKDNEVGTVEVYYDGQNLGSAKIVTQRAVERSPAESFWRELGDFLSQPTVKTILLIAIVLLSLVVFTFSLLIILRRRRRFADERKAIRDCLAEDKQDLKEYKKQYWIDRKQRQKKKKAEKERRRREQLRRQHQEYQRMLARTARQNNPSQSNSAPPSTPPAPPPAPPTRRGDEYYRK